MNDEIVIRKAVMKDLPAMARLLGELFRIEKDFIADERKQTRGLRLLMARHETAIALTACHGKKVIGMATGQSVISTAEGDVSVRVEDVIVSRGYRNRGVGKQLLGVLKIWATGLGATRMELVADRTNAGALEFYSKLGWKETRLVCRHFRIKRPPTPRKTSK